MYRHWPKQKELAECRYHLRLSKNSCLLVVVGAVAAMEGVESAHLMVEDARADLYEGGARQCVLLHAHRECGDEAVVIHLVRVAVVGLVALFLGQH